jgi:hypothetical protein
MSNAADIATLVAGVISFITGEVAVAVWLYRRGRKSGVEQIRQAAERQARAEADAQMETLKKEIADLKTQLILQPPKRRLW